MSEAEQPEERTPLTADERRRNVERVKAIEGRLEMVERRFGEMVLAGAGALRELHSMRVELRDVFGMEPLPPLAPLYEGLAARAEAGGETGGTAAEGDGEAG